MASASTASTASTTTTTTIPNSLHLHDKYYNFLQTSLTTTFRLKTFFHYDLDLVVSLLRRILPRHVLLQPEPDIDIIP